MNFLNQPFPRNISLRKQFINGLISGCIVAVFLRVMRPFGIANAPAELTKLCISYGLITVFICFLFLIVELLFPGYYKEEKWTVGKNIVQYVLLVFFIGVGNFLFTCYGLGLPFSILNFFSFQLFTLSVSVCVISILTMSRYFSSMNYYRSHAAEMDKDLQEQVKSVDTKTNIDESSATNEIIFTSENEKEKISFNTDQLLFIVAADNYCKIFYTDGKQNKTVMIRSSLKRMESQLPGFFFRCHRGYIINPPKVNHVSGNSQGYRLHFENFEQTVPVARNNNKELKSILKAYTQS